MRRLPLLLALLPLACRPTATVERTTPIADLKVYRVLSVRVGGGGPTSRLEQAVLRQVGTRCSFEDVRVGAGTDGDLLVDVNIQGSGRGGEGIIQNPNVAFLDALVVLTDGIDGELIGSALVRGKSSAMLIEGGASPEDQAVDVVAKTVAEIMQKSGCQGPRATRATKDVATPAADAGPVAPTSGADAGPTAPADASRAAAEAANEEGKRLFRDGQIHSALVQFERAVGLARDPRYLFNICLAHDSLGQLDKAIAACEEARGLHPSAGLAAKVDHRLTTLRERR